MKKLLTVMVVALLSSAALAQDGPEKRMRLGADLAVGLPLGDFGDLADLAIGGLIDFDFALQPQLYITGRTGYIHYLIDLDGFSYGTIPLWGGVKFYLAPPGAMRLFAAAELGFNFNRATVEVLGISASDSETDLGLTLGGGIELGPLSIRAHFAIIDLGHAGDSLMVLATAGYYFLAF